MNQLENMICLTDYPFHSTIISSRRPIRVAGRHFLFMLSLVISLTMSRSFLQFCGWAGRLISDAMVMLRKITIDHRQAAHYNMPECRSAR